MDPEKGLVGLPWSGFREAWFSETADRLVVVNYNSLAREPKRVLGRLYVLLQQPAFEHDVGNVVYEESDYDADLGLPGLHRVRRTVALEERSTCLPPDLFAKYADTAFFWTNPRLNARNVTVL